jgi:hypothetical protein
MTFFPPHLIAMFLAIPSINKAFLKGIKMFPLRKVKEWKCCQHGLRKERCRLCNGRAFCCHNRRKEFCIPCGGGSMCEHKRERRMCKECKQLGKGGASLCAHFKKKRDCKDCKKEEQELQQLVQDL